MLITGRIIPTILGKGWRFPEIGPTPWSSDSALGLSLVSLIFLKSSVVFPISLFSSISLHWLLRKAFLTLLTFPWKCVFKWVYLPCSPFPLASLLSQLFLRPPFCFIDHAKAFNCDHNKLWKILKKMGTPDHLTCLLRNLYAGQEATVRMGHRTMDWFQFRKGVRQGYILLSCVFKLYT